MEERPAGVNGKDRHGAGRRVAALVGVLLGFGLLAAIAFAFAGDDGGLVGAEEQGSEPTNDSASTAPTTKTPPDPVLRIVFPEGFTREEMAGRIAAVNEIAEQKRNITPKLRPREYLLTTERVRGLPTDFRNVDAPNLEGFLFPATYEFTEQWRSRRLANAQLEAFGRAWDEIGVGYARRRNLTPYDIVIIASMIEKEVQVPRERALVAAVIYNRLRAGMPLGIDATIRYGLDIPPTEPILQSQLESDSPYNTRRFAGLPPTPIGNPGLASLEAAARPANVDFLYFVRKADCKSHFFTVDEREFLEYPRAGLQC